MGWDEESLKVSLIATNAVYHGLTVTEESLEYKESETMKDKLLVHKGGRRINLLAVPLTKQVAILNATRALELTHFGPRLEVFNRLENHLVTCGKVYVSKDGLVKVSGLHRF